MSKNILMMAFSAGQVSTEGSEVKRYIGTGVAKVLCVNPTSAQIKEFMGYEPKEEPVYFGMQDTPDGNKLPYFRVTFIVRTVPEKSNGIETTQMLTYFVRKQYVQGSQSGKYQVRDNYGNTAWGTKEEINAKSEIKYTNGPAKLIGEYKPLYVGERALMRFFQEFLVIGSHKDTSGYDYINGTWVPMSADKLKDCECTFSNDELEMMFKGNFTPIKNSLALQPNNEVRVLFGIRTTDDGKEYQDIYTRPLRLRVNNWDVIQQEIDESKERGGLKNRTYEFCELKEYKPTATDFNAESTPSDNPFGEAPVGSTPW